MKTLIIGIIALLSICSCSKNGGTEQPDMTNQHTALVTGTWEIVAKTGSIAYDWNGDGTPETDIYSSMTGCQKGFNIYFAPGMDGVVHQDCATLQKQITWNLSDKGWKLNWTITGSSAVSEKIISISATQLRTETKAQPPGSNEITITTTYQKQ